MSSRVAAQVLRFLYDRGVTLEKEGQMLGSGLINISEVESAEVDDISWLILHYSIRPLNLNMWLHGLTFEVKVVDIAPEEIPTLFIEDAKEHFRIALAWVKGAIEVVEDMHNHPSEHAADKRIAELLKGEE